MRFDGSPVRRPDWWFNWDDAAIARLRELDAQGLTAAKIAAELGCSRGAVIGKRDRLRRMDFAKQQREPPPSGARFQKIVAGKPPKDIPPEHVIVAKAPPAPPPTPKQPPQPNAVPKFRCVPIMKLNEAVDCRWIINEPPARALYCGLPRSDSPGYYCPYHRRLAYVRSSASPSHQRVIFR